MEGDITRPGLDPAPASQADAVDSSRQSVHPGTLSANPPSSPPETQQVILSSADLRLQELRHTLTQQISTFTAVGTRATTLLSILVGTVSAAVAIERAVAPSIPLWAFALIVIVVALVLVASLLVPSTLLMNTTVDIGEDPETLKQKSTLTAPAFHAWLIEDYSEMIKGNRAALIERASVFERAMILLLAAATILIVTSTILYASVILG
jgi:hypothetical protein